MTAQPRSRESDRPALTACLSPRRPLNCRAEVGLGPRRVDRTHPPSLDGSRTGIGALAPYRPYPSGPRFRTSVSGS